MRLTTLLALALGTQMTLVGCALFPPPDDNGDFSFVRQVVPMVLGRKAKGAAEVKLLADLIPKVGRDGVVGVLMEQPEFVRYWTDAIVDHLQLQRDGNRAQDPACFGDPLRTTLVTRDLADHVRTQSPNDPAPGGDFNMIDLIESAIMADDLSAIYQAYPIPLTARIWWGADQNKRQDIATAFNHTMVNRQVDCLQCHNSRWSCSGLMQCTAVQGPLWNRTHPIPLALEDALYGLPNPSLQGFANLFRQDQLSDDPGSSTNTAISPWGMTSGTKTCGKMLTTLPVDPTPISNLDAVFAGEVGKQVGLINIVTKFKTGSEDLKAHGLTGVVPSGGGLPEVPATQLDRGYAYMVALTITENIWQQLMGEKLTIVNYFPRNPDERDTLRTLTNVFIGSGFSLKDLIATITTNRLFNRRAPDVASGTTSHRLKMIFDPWVEHDPRLGPDPDPRVHNNSQGDLVHRYSPNNLLRSVEAALGWPGPKRFPHPTDYPNSQLVKAIGQYTSDYEPGLPTMSFQGLLNWESQHGVCQKPVGVTTDWIDRLIDSAVPAFNAANSINRATLKDVVLTMKDWLIGEQTLSSVNRINGNSDEERALALLFGVSTNTFGVIDTPTNAVPFLKEKARRYCGVLLESPRFMLAGIEPSTGMTPPRLRVCNGTPCTYAEMCAVYGATLAATGTTINCHDNSIDLTIANDPFCTQAFCMPVSSNAARSCERNPRNCNVGPLTLRIREARACGSAGCGPDWIDSRKPLMFAMLAEGTRVASVRNAEIKPIDATGYRPLRQGEVLPAGAVLRLPPDAVLDTRADRRIFATPATGLPSKFTRNQRPIDRELIAGVERGSPDAVAALLNRGANVNTRDRFGETPLMKAAAAGNPAIVELLLRRGADLAARDARDFTAADAAAARKQAPIVALLAKRGLLAKSERERAQAPTPVAEPSFVLVVGNNPPPIDRTRLTPFAAWQLGESGELGPKMLTEPERRTVLEQIKTRRARETVRHTVQEAEAERRRYMREDFAKEHPHLVKK
ncbi:MAG: ankyrin repeat domain-containing protein [Xanthobacteraceae bacterium]